MTASQAAERGLLEKYAPALRFHPQEPYRADSPATMATAAFDGVRGTRLLSEKGVLLASAVPTGSTDLLDLAYLDATYPEGSAASKHDRLLPDPDFYEADAREMHLRALLGDRIYARAVQEDGGRVWLQYWFFYYFNDKSLAGIGRHEGDWEMIQIGLDGAGHPEVATFAQHIGGERREWKDVKTIDDEPDAPPIVFVALGSHASYFQTGHYLLKPWLLLRDHAVDGVPVRPAIEHLDGARWPSWPGRWGRPGAPQGPMQHLQWDRPDSWHLGRRVHGPRRVRVGKTFFVLRDEAVAPPLALHATRDGGDVTLRWELAELDPAAEHLPARILLSVGRAASTDPPVVLTLAAVDAEGSALLSAPSGTGPLIARATVFDAGDESSVPVETPVIEPPGGARPRGIARDRHGARRARGTRAPVAGGRGADLRDRGLVRLIVKSPEGHAADDLRAAVDEQLGVDDGAPWRVAPLFPRTGAPAPERLTGYFSVVGRLPASTAYPLGAAAFDAARRLQQAAGADVHPDLPTSVMAPRRGSEPDTPRAARAARAAPADDSWPLKHMRIREAWSLEPSRGTGVRIAQPDTGVTAHWALDTPSLDRSHDLDVLDDDRDATDPLRTRWWRLLPNPGHGTATASVVIAAGRGAPYGTAPGATLIPIRCINSVVQVFDADLAIAIEYARQLGVDIITMSIGGEGFSPALGDAVAAAVDDGIVVLAAGGNYAPFVPAPARLPACLAVAATNEHDRPWRWTSPGKEIDWSAPGEDVSVAGAKREYGEVAYSVRLGSGSSFAVAHSAGAAALWIAKHGREMLRQRYPGAVQWAFRQAVVATVHDPGTGWNQDAHGLGILNAERLLSALPAQVDAQPPRRARAMTASPAARLAPLLPELAEAQLRERLSGLLGVPDAALDDALERAAGELAHHLTEDLVLRDEIVAGELARARERLAPVVSTDLAARIEAPNP